MTSVVDGGGEVEGGLEGLEAWMKQRARWDERVFVFLELGGRP